MNDDTTTQLPPEPYQVCEGDTKCVRNAEFEARVKGDVGTGRDGRVRLCVLCQANARANGILVDTYPIDCPPPANELGQAQLPPWALTAAQQIEPLLDPFFRLNSTAKQEIAITITAAYTRFVNEPQNEAGETAAEPEDIIYALRARVAELEAGSRTGEAQIDPLITADWLDELEKRVTPSIKLELGGQVLQGGDGGNWIGILTTERDAICRTLRLLTDLAVSPTGDEKCVNHCGHDAELTYQGVCRHQDTKDAAICGHRCEFSRPAPCGGCDGVTVHHTCGKQPDARPVSEAAKRASGSILTEVFESRSEFGMLKEPVRGMLKKEIAAIIESELTKESTL